MTLLLLALLLQPPVEPPEAALSRLDRRIAEAPGNWRALVERGSVRFRLGQIEPSLADFDLAVELSPGQEPYLWQRGISQYYGGRFAACRAQFEIHRTVNPADVENAVWHFLCVARGAGIEEARRTLLPVAPDRRIPMAEIYGLFAGAGSVEEVLAAAGSEADHRAARFYAHLYVGLYLEVTGVKEESRSHLAAAHSLRFPHYMGDVARVHLSLHDREAETFNADRPRR